MRVEVKWKMLFWFNADKLILAANSEVTLVISCTTQPTQQVLPKGSGRVSNKSAATHGTDAINCTPALPADL